MLEIDKYRLKIQELFSTLTLVKSNNGNTGVDLRDLGLIITGSDAMFDEEKVAGALPGDYVFFVLDNSYYGDDFIGKLTEANAKGLPFIVDCQVDPPPVVVQVLHQLSEENKYSYFKDGELVSISLNSKTSIVFVIRADTLEQKISHPFFLSLFGPILRLE